MFALTPHTKKTKHPEVSLIYFSLQRRQTPWIQRRQTPGIQRRRQTPGIRRRQTPWIRRRQTPLFNLQRRQTPIQRRLCIESGSWLPKLLSSRLLNNFFFFKRVSTYGIRFWWEFFIISPRHQSVFSVGGNWISDILYNHQRLYQLS